MTDDRLHVPHLGPSLGIQTVVSALVCVGVLVFTSWLTFLISIVWILLMMYWMRQAYLDFKWVSRPLPEKTLDDDGWVE